jgi:hypothetical protein
MKRLLLIISIILGGSPLLYSYTGETEPQMLKMVYGARALAMGGAFVGLADDLYYMDSNPARGDVSDNIKVSILHQEWIADVNYEAIRLAKGFREQVFVGLGFTYLYLPFTHYDIFGESIGNSHILSQSLGTLNFGYTFKKFDVSVGTNLKFYYNHIPEELYPGQSYFLFAFDLGIIARINLLKRYVSNEPSLTFGLALKNFGSSNEVERLPTEVHVGASYRLFQSLLLSTEFALPVFEPVYGALGAEFNFNEMFFIEGGMQIKNNPMFALGLGYKRNNIRLDVSYTPSIAFYNVIGVSLTYSFGEMRSQRNKLDVEKNLLNAADRFENGKYDEALKIVERVLELYPENSKAVYIKEEIVAATKW